MLEQAVLQVKVEMVFMIMLEQVDVVENLTVQIVVLVELAVLGIHLEQELNQVKMVGDPLLRELVVAVQGEQELKESMEAVVDLVLQVLMEISVLVSKKD